MANSERHKLPQELADQIFQRDIAPDLLHGEPSPDPTVVFVIGQPGAGKSRAEAALRAKLGHDAAVGLDIDEFRPYHPDYEQLAQIDDRTAAAHVQPDGSRWLDMGIDLVIAQRTNAVVSSTFGNPVSAEANIARFREAGYNVQVAAIGVHETHSQVSVISRYDHQREQNGYGRFVPEEIQRAAYEGLPATVAHIEEHKLADVVYVYDRSGQQIYSNDLLDGEWRETPAMATTLQQVREHNLVSEAQWFVDQVDRLDGRLPKDLRGNLQTLTETAVQVSAQLTPDPAVRQLYERALNQLQQQAPGIDIGSIDDSSRNLPGDARENTHEAHGIDQTQRHDEIGD